MPRGPREQSESGIYHVMVRGVNQAQLFYDDEDREAFLERLARYKGECGFEIYAWCLMGNHVHLLLREGPLALSDALKRLLLSYSHYFNEKYDRSGYLYQGRHKRKPVDDDGYLLAAVRYIHRNPLEIGEPVDSWTSYGEYMGTSGVADTGFVLGVLDASPAEARRLFKELVEGDGFEGGYSFGGGGRMRDAEAVEAIKALAHVENCTDVSGMGRGELAELLPALKKRGLTVRQIARLTGLNRGIVQRA